MLQYRKAPISIEKQIVLLASRGLHIENESAAKEALSRINYYRFSGYCIPFESKRHVFREDASFERVLRLYNHDDNIRNALTQVLRDFEIFFRSILAHTLSMTQYDTFAHYNTSLFRTEQDPFFKFEHNRWLDGIHKEAYRSSETFISHYKRTYDSFPKLPIWMATEIMSMGKLSQLYSGLLAKHQRPIVGRIKTHFFVLHTWLHTMTYLRNICAHHARIANRKLAIRPALPRKDKRWRGLSPERLYASVVMLEYIIRAGNLALAPIKKLYATMKALLEDEPWFARQMGVPRKWDGSMYWKGEQEL